MKERLNISSAAKWEALAGYSRAVRIGDIIEVAGTTAIDENGELVGRDDAYEQTRYILAKIEKALAAAGGAMQDVIRTRMYVTNIGHWQAVARAHADYFRDIKPAATMVEVRSLIEPDMLVEIEVTAVVP
jgi:enamine deaminase RidA (YjgF/YER057c/UK114 family)